MKLLVGLKMEYELFPTCLRRIEFSIELDEPVKFKFYVISGTSWKLECASEEKIPHYALKLIHAFRFFTKSFWSWEYESMADFYRSHLFPNPLGYDPRTQILMYRLVPEFRGKEWLKSVRQNILSSSNLNEWKKMTLDFIERVVK